MQHSNFNMEVKQSAAGLYSCLGVALCSFSISLVLVFSGPPAQAKTRQDADPAFKAASVPDASMQPASSGAIFRSGYYVPLTSGTRAGQVGDVLTVVLVERTSATKSNSATTDRGGDIGLAPPTTGPLSVFQPTDVKMGGNQSFTGKGNAAQSNALSGEVSVTVAEVYPNGTMRVRGEKRLTLNRGDERIQLSGIVRIADVSQDNRVLSTRIADADIRYVGKGEIARASRQGWLQRFFSVVSPF